MALGVAVPEAWETGLRELNADLGALRQVDVTAVFTTSSDPEFADAIEQKWVYGPKNGLILVVGLAADHKTFAWVRVVTISRVEALKVALRDGLTGLTLADANKALPLIRRQITDRFRRTPMSEFEYLASAAAPSAGVLAGLYGLALALCVGLLVLAHREDFFGDSSFDRRGKYRPYHRF